MRAQMRRAPRMMRGEHHDDNDVKERRENAVVAHSIELVIRNVIGPVEAEAPEPYDPEKDEAAGQISRNRALSVLFRAWFRT